MNHECFRRQQWVDTVVSMSVAAADALGAVLCLLLLYIFVVLGVGWTLLAPSVGPLVVFVPGYALVSEQFADAGDETGPFTANP